MDRSGRKGEVIGSVSLGTHIFIDGGIGMAKQIIIYEKGVDKKELAASACCANAPTGRMLK
jgi:hypothetical protein